MKLPKKLSILGFGLLAFLVVVAASIGIPKLVNPSLVSGSNLPAPGQSSAIAETPPASLREAAQRRDFLIGAAVPLDPLRKDSSYREVLAREFNSLSPENELKFSRLHPEPDRYDFTQAAEIIDFAQENQMQVYGHVLVWYRSLPDWVTEGEWTREEAKNILKNHIYTVMGRFRGQVLEWDVVNEAISNDGSLRGSYWKDAIGDDYIELAFRWAHEADPDAVLYYNDHEGEALNDKSDGIYALVSDLKQRGVPIDGVGFQMHIGIDRVPNPEHVAQNMKRLADLGLEVKITEMDVQTRDGRGTDAERQTQQAAAYKAMTDVCLAAPNCTGLTTWGVSDNYSWVPYFYNEPDAPLLFDADYQPKPAYDAVMESLMSAPTSTSDRA